MFIALVFLAHIYVDLIVSATNVFVVFLSTINKHFLLLLSYWSHRWSDYVWSVCCVMCCLYGTTTLGTIFDTPRLSGPGHQPGNRWFVHTKNQSNIMTPDPWLLKPCQWLWLCPDYLIESFPGWTHGQLTMVQTGDRYWIETNIYQWAQLNINSKQQ